MKLFEKYQNDVHTLASLVFIDDCVETGKWILHCCSAAVTLALILYTLNAVKVPADFYIIVVAPLSLFTFYALTEATITYTKAFLRRTRDTFKEK